MWQGSIFISNKNFHFQFFYLRLLSPKHWVRWISLFPCGLPGAARALTALMTSLCMIISPTLTPLLTFSPAWWSQTALSPVTPPRPKQGSYLDIVEVFLRLMLFVADLFTRSWVLAAVWWTSSLTPQCWLLSPTQSSQQPPSWWQVKCDA